MLLDPGTWTLASRIEDVLEGLPPALAGRASAETHSCVVEIATRPHETAAAAAAELADVRRTLCEVVERRLGLRAAAAGTHPFAAWPDVDVSGSPRYREIHASMRELARREPTLALHVHVAVPSGEAAAAALDGLRTDLPLLLALSANSPFWQGRDSGLASARSPVFSMFPRTGIPRSFGGYAAYVGAVEAMCRSGAVPDYSFLWWDARLQPRLGTVEVRIMDAQTRVDDVAALAALVQCMVRLYAEGHSRPAAGTFETLAENRFLAARDGMNARLIDLEALVMRPAHDRLETLLAQCAPLASMLGCTPELEATEQLAAEPGHLRQRITAARRGLHGLVVELSAEFADRRFAPSDELVDAATR